MSEKIRRILIVDDQPSVRRALRMALEADGFAVAEASGAGEIMDCLAQPDPIDLITLDVMLGHEDGLALLSEIRTTRNIPIILITARVTPVDRVKGLEHGADDYIVKPFHFREVLLRIHAVLRRYAPQPDIDGSDGVGGGEIYGWGAGFLDVKRRELQTKAGERVLLTDAEFDILVAFLRNPARVLSRDELSMLTKGRSWSPQDRTLDGHVGRLRKKIEPDGAEPTYIKTVWRVGYIFTADVTRQN